MKINKFKYSLLGGMAILFGLAACSPDEYGMGAKDVTSADLIRDVSYSIEHDASNDNIVYLKSLMGSNYLQEWETPQGRYQSDVEMHIAFPGTYTVKFGVNTPGGIVYADPDTFNIAKFYAGFVDDPMWTLLTGGVGESKTWIPDNGNYGLCSDEMSYADPSTNPTYNNFTTNWDPGVGYTDATKEYFNSDITFDLKGAANAIINSAHDGTVDHTEGTFQIDTDNKTITFSNCELLHPYGWSHMTSDWKNNLQIMTLTENQLRIGILREKATSGEDPWWLIWNFVSKDYADSYVPPVDPNPAPTLASTWKDDITQYNYNNNTYRTIKWKMAETTDGVAYADLYGAQTGGQSSASDDGLEYSLTMCIADHSYTSTDVDGNSVEGTFEIQDNGFIKFSNGLQKATVAKDGSIIKTNSDNTLRVLSYTMDGTELTDLYLGYDMYDAQGKRYQYKEFHFVPTIVGQAQVESFKAGLHFFDSAWAFQDSPTVKVTGDGTYTFTVTGSSSDPYGIYLDVTKILAKHPNIDMTITDMRVDGKSIAFDDAAIDRGYGDEKDAAGNGITARRYILNPWNNDNYFMANGTDVLKFSSTLEVDLKIVYESGTAWNTVASAKAMAKAKAAVKAAKAKAAADKAALARALSKKK